MSEEKCCPDLGFLIVFKQYMSAGIYLTGHAAVAVLNGRTGELNGYDFGPDDHVHELKLGYVRDDVKDVIPLGKNCLPHCGMLERFMKRIAERYGVDARHDVALSGNISGVMYRLRPGSFEKSVAYASDKARINEEYKLKISEGKNSMDKELPDSYHYKVHTNNCMSFALSVIAGEKSGLPAMIEWPADDVLLAMLAVAGPFGAGANFSYIAKTGRMTCNGCCTEN